jgi:hypothetical protein
MANNANKVFVGKPLVTGGIYAAPVGTALPTDSVVALNSAFQTVGYVTDDGLTKTVNRDSATVFAWGGDTIALIQKSFSADFKFKMAEYLSVVTQTLLYGSANVSVATATGTDSVAVQVTSQAPPHNSWVVEMKQGNGRVRLVIPDGVISDTGDVVYKDDDVASLEVTVTAFADPTAHFFYEYLTSPAAANKAAAAPGAAFAAEATITASDSTNAAKLTGLGYVAAPQTAWTTGQQITVGGFAFNWTSAAWAAGAHA